MLHDEVCLRVGEVCGRRGRVCRRVVRKRFPRTTLRCSLPILLTGQQEKRVALLLVRKSSSVCDILLSVISLLNS